MIRRRVFGKRIARVQGNWNTCMVVVSPNTCQMYCGRLFIFLTRYFDEYWLNSILSRDVFQNHNVMLVDGCSRYDFRIVAPVAGWAGGSIRALYALAVVSPGFAIWIQSANSSSSPCQLAATNSTSSLLSCT